MRKIFIGALILMSMIHGNPPQAGSSEPQRIYQARELWEAFANEPDKAHGAFTGQRIAFEGVVLSSGPSQYATPMVVLSDRAGGERYVACILPRTDFFKLADYKKGDVRRFTGVCRGMTFDGSMVLFKESKNLIE